MIERRLAPFLKFYIVMKLAVPVKGYLELQELQLLAELRLIFCMEVAVCRG